ncbi:nucleotide sugar dehydrogenase [Candidatus Altiarchaeota archaeon]
MGKEKICIVGLGYVGLPLAVLAAGKGYEIIGLEVNQEIVEKINSGVCHISDQQLQKEFEGLKGRIRATSDAEEAIPKSEVVVVCVPTPIDEKNNPDLEPLEKAAKSISMHMGEGQLIVIESTIYPGVTERVIKPLLEKSGLKAGTDFYLAHCPERIDPGNKKWNIENIPRVIGAFTPEGLKKSSEFYRSLLEAEVMELSSIRSVEASKVVENTFRDINIAFVNELSKSFDKLSIDVVEVINAASTKPFSFLPHYPGCGVGGHCIPVDPYYLIDRAKQSGFDHRFLSLAREINNSMPSYTVELLVDSLNKIGKSLKGTKVGILGLAYKGDVDDIRESPALKIVENLKEKGAKVKVFDPYLPDRSDYDNVQDLLIDCEVVVLATPHKEFSDLDFSKAKNLKVVVDGRNVLDKESIESLGILYKGIGR